MRRGCLRMWTFFVVGHFANETFCALTISFHCKCMQLSSRCFSFIEKLANGRWMEKSPRHIGLAREIPKAHSLSPKRVVYIVSGTYVYSLENKIVIRVYNEITTQCQNINFNLALTWLNFDFIHIWNLMLIELYVKDNLIEWNLKIDAWGVNLEMISALAYVFLRMLILSNVSVWLIVV